jgi:spermidine synthase
MAHAILARAEIPGSEMVLVRRGKHVAIRVGQRTLMSSDVHDSEDEFGRIIAAAVAGVAKPRILIGGLGLGFTLRTALDGLPRTARVDVAELVPEVVRWNKAEYGVYAGRPLNDRRVRLHVEDVADAITRGENTYDVISLDVDNGPNALTHPDNENLYRRAGLARVRKALRPGGVLAVWSSFPSRLFTKSLEVIGSVELVRTTPTFPGGPRYYIWLASKRGRSAPSRGQKK